MRALDGCPLSPAEIEDLAFEATGELRAALNEAYIRLMEYAYDCAAELGHPQTNVEMSARLQASLDEIIQLADRPQVGGSR